MPNLAPEFAFFGTELVGSPPHPESHLRCDSGLSPQAGGAKEESAYFGLTVGSPPGLPGGGMTGMAPSVLGAGACMSGSTPEGGQSTPSDLASLSPSGSRDWPVVVPSGAVARFGRSCGMQLAACWAEAARSLAAASPGRRGLRDRGA